MQALLNYGIFAKNSNIEKYESESMKIFEDIVSEIGFDKDKSTVGFLDEIKSVAYYNIAQTYGKRENVDYAIEKGLDVINVADEFDDVLTPWKGKNGEDFKPVLKGNKTLLILAESWGEPKNTSEKNIHINSLRAAGINIEVNTTIGTSGSTVSAEMRELCRLNNKSVVIEPNSTIFKDCLPNRAKALGYHTYSIHAASGGMYDRLDWYPKVGFEHSEFYGTIPQDGIRKCKSMPGLCDVDMMEHVFSQIKNEKKIFYYWLTLNSHFPYDSRDIFIPTAKCSKINLLEDSQRCRHFLLQEQFFESLADYISKHKSELKGTQVIIVGDHSPPFYTDQDREAFHENVVPIIAFTIY